MANLYRSGMTDSAAAKRSAAVAAANLVEDGMRVGLGTGSTVRFALERLAERIASENLKLEGVPTSRATEDIARELGIPLIDLQEVEGLDLAIDGADEVDPHKVLIKGGGGALVREKIVAAAARELLVVVDEAKLVSRIGAAFPLPVEVLVFGWRQTMRSVAAHGCEPVLRKKDEQPVLSDNGNYILDCKFEGIEDPAWLHDAINAIPGVVDNGLFVGLAGRIFVGNADGEVRTVS